LRMAKPKGVTGAPGASGSTAAGKSGEAALKDPDTSRDTWDDDEKLIETAPATPEQMAVLNRQAARTLLRVIVVQVVAAVAVGIMAWGVAGVAAGVSALVGAGAYMVPSVLFALRLLLGMVKPQGANPATFFFGEFFKLGSTALL